MWKLIKLIIYTALVAGVVLTLTGYKIEGKTVPEYLKSLVGSGKAGEGIKDIRSLVGEAMKAVGSEISKHEEVTESERQELDKLVKQQMDQKVLPPEKK